MKRQGYIALTTSLLISISIFLVIGTVGVTSFLNQRGVDQSYYKSVSRGLAESCIQTALFRLAASSSYSGNETIAVASDTCRIFGVAASGSDKILTVQGVFQDSYTNLQLQITSTTFAVADWKEINDL